jgi:hypothetical protein
VSRLYSSNPGISGSIDPLILISASDRNYQTSTIALFEIGGKFVNLLTTCGRI